MKKLDYNSDSDGRQAAPDFEALVVSARQGNREAFNLIAREYWVEINRFLFHRLPTAQDAEDMAQEVFIKVQLKIKGLKNPGDFKGWLYRIALNQARDYYRKRKVRAFLGLKTDRAEESDRAENDGPDLLGEMMKKEFWKAVKEFVLELPPGEREVFRLRFLDQLPMAEAARLLDKNPNTVKTQLYRATAKLKKNKKLMELLGGLS